LLDQANSENRKIIQLLENHMPKQVIPSHISPFEQIKHADPDNGAEYWSSREFAAVLGYADYDNFKAVIKKAKQACFNSGREVTDHFRDITEMIAIGKGGMRQVKTVQMSRYACYLVIQNADPQKEIVAQGQTYFAVQTRIQEIQEAELEDDRRLHLRDEIRQHNTQLADAARNAGVVEPIDYAIFQNHGYMGLYNGLKMADIHKRKGLKSSQKILDHMGSSELAANYFRATQTEDKLRRENIKGKAAANAAHFTVGREVRATIKKLDGTMPEDLPTADSIKKLEAKRAKQLPKPAAPETLPDGADESDEQ
jgi:DNA-damage-inducible protein D